MADAKLVTSVRVYILEVREPERKRFRRAEWAVKVSVDGGEPRWVLPGDHLDVICNVELGSNL